MDSLTELPPRTRDEAAGSLRAAPIVDLAIRIGVLGLLLYLALLPLRLLSLTLLNNRAAQLHS